MNKFFENHNFQFGKIATLVIIFNLQFSIFNQVHAQETYESAQIATEDLNGTARYIGMGGAMEALGADISTMGTNPAGIGLFRRSWIGISGGTTIQNGQENRNTMANIGRDKGITNADLNQVGFIYSNKFSYNSHFNLGFNYHKSRNFNQIISAMNSLDGYSSSNKLSVMRCYNFDRSYGIRKDRNGEYFNPNISLVDDANMYAVNDYLETSNYLYGKYEYGARAADGYNAYRENSGYIGEYDFNFSANFNDRVYLGLTFGVKDVNYKSNYRYGEFLISDDAEGLPDGEYSFVDDREVTGTGFDVKFGTIIRPSEYSPFRFGLYLHTPTWYDLTAKINMRAEATSTGATTNSPTLALNYDYRIMTPWKFGVSVGHTFGKIVAIGATYEYADYSNIKNRIKTGYDTYQYTDGWYYYYDRRDTYANDLQMNNNTRNTLKGVSLVKVGVEVKPSQVLAFRLGYNYQSAIYKDDGYKDSTIDADYCDGKNGQGGSTHDYTNWKGTNRITFGIGFTFDKNWTLDLSYQYATQKGEYHPFESSNIEGQEIGRGSFTEGSGTVSNTDTPCEVKNNRHQINATLGYRF